MSTISEVAKRAGVSNMTVSRVINNNGYVKKETYDTVVKAIKELDYRPNLLAKGLLTRKTKTIAHVMVNVSNLFHPKVIQGVEEACYEMQYNVVICDANTKNREKEYINNLTDRFIDGMIFHHLNINTKQIYQLEENHICCVVIDNENVLDDCSNIITDNAYGGYLAGKHLLDLGHKKIAVIHGSLNFNESKKQKEYEETFQFSIWNKRLNGFLKALKENGLSMDPGLMFEGEGTTVNSIKSGYNAMQRILSLDEKPTAIYAQNDHMAIGAMNAAIEAGFKIPDDFSIVGHDGLDIDELLIPKLTSVEQPRYEMGYQAAKLLIELIEGKAQNQIINLTPKLIVRQTTKQLD